MDEKILSRGVLRKVSAYVRAGKIKHAIVTVITNTPGHTWDSPQLYELLVRYSPTLKPHSVRAELLYLTRSKFGKMLIPEQHKRKKHRPVIGYGLPEGTGMPTRKAIELAQKRSDKPVKKTDAKKDDGPDAKPAVEKPKKAVRKVKATPKVPARKMQKPRVVLKDVDTLQLSKKSIYNMLKGEEAELEFTGTVKVKIINR